MSSAAYRAEPFRRRVSILVPGGVFALSVWSYGWWTRRARPEAREEQAV